MYDGFTISEMVYCIEEVVAAARKWEKKCIGTQSKCKIKSKAYRKKIINWKKLQGAWYDAFTLL